MSARAGLSLLATVVALIYIPVQLTRCAVPTILPLRLAQLFQPLSELQLPVDLLMFHVVLPFTLERLRPVPRDQYDLDTISKRLMCDC